MFSRHGGQLSAQSVIREKANWKSRVFYMLALEVVTHCQFTLFTWLHNLAFLNMGDYPGRAHQDARVVGGHVGGWRSRLPIGPAPPMGLCPPKGQASPKSCANPMLADMARVLLEKGQQLLISCLLDTGVARCHARPPHFCLGSSTHVISTKTESACHGSLRHTPRLRNATSS